MDNYNFDDVATYTIDVEPLELNWEELDTIINKIELEATENNYSIITSNTNNDNFENIWRNMSAVYWWPNSGCFIQYPIGSNYVTLDSIECEEDDNAGLKLL